MLPISILRVLLHCIFAEEKLHYIGTFVVSVIIILQAGLVGPAFAQELLQGSVKSALAGVQNAQTEAARAMAVQKLKALKPAIAEDVHALLDALRHKSISPPILAEVLMNAEDPQLAPIYLQALNDPDMDVQMASVRTLGKMKSREAAKSLIAKFKSLPPDLYPSANMSREVLKQTAQLGSYLAWALGRIGDPGAVPYLIARPEFYFLEGATPLAEIGALAVPALLRAAKDKKNPHSDKVRTIISSIKDPAAVPALFAVLKDGDVDAPLKTSAFIALAKMGTPGIDAEAQALLTDKDERARLGALYWMVKYDKTTYTPKLIEFLHDKSWLIRAVTAQFAGELGVSEAAPRLIELLNDTDDAVKRNALFALEKLFKTRAAITVLDVSRVQAIFTIEGKHYKTVIRDASLVREEQRGGIKRENR